MTAKLTLDTRYASKAGLYPIVVRVRSGNQQRHVKTGYKIPKVAWNKTEVKRSYPNASSINASIADTMAAVKTKMIEASRKGIEDLDLMLKGETEEAPMLFSQYIESRAKQYDEEKKLKHALKLRRLNLYLQQCFTPSPVPLLYTEKQKEAFYRQVPVPFTLTLEDVRKLNIFLKNAGNGANTINHKMGKLRQLFNNARAEGKTDAINPFMQFHAPTKPVHKEKLNKEEVKLIEEVALPDGKLNDVRNFFLFSYYCKGMRFEDCLRFKTAYIIKDRLIFPEVRKGNDRITVDMHPRLKALIAPYRHNEPYLFPFLKEELLIDKTGTITEEGEKERLSKVEGQNTIINRYLKTIIAACGIDKKISMHNSRHSFAQNLKDSGAHLNVIQDALAHSTQAVTERYLKSLDDRRIDKEVNKLYE